MLGHDGHDGGEMSALESPVGEHRVALARGKRGDRAHPAVPGSHPKDTARASPGSASAAHAVRADATTLPKCTGRRVIA